MSFSAEVEATLESGFRASRIDLYRFPIVDVWMGNTGVDELRGHVREMNEVLGRGRAGVVYDVREANIFSAAERQVYFEYFRLRREFLEARCAAVGIVIDSAIKRGVLTAIQWAMPFPVRAFAQKSDAEGWVKRQLAA